MICVRIVNYSPIQVSNGMWDAGKPWKAMYASAASQRCAMQSSICTNPALAVLSSNLVEFYFPIGDGLVNPTHLAPGNLPCQFVSS